MSIVAAILDPSSMVINIILLDSLNQLEGAVDGRGASIGDKYVDGVFEKEPQEEEVVAVPSEVSQRQAKEELIDIDLIDAIEAFLNAIPDAKQKRIGLNWYNNSQVFMRNNEFLNYVWTYLGKSQEELDTLFINASKR